MKLIVIKFIILMYLILSINMFSLEFSIEKSLFRKRIKKSQYSTFMSASLQKVMQLGKKSLIPVQGDLPSVKVSIIKIDEAIQNVNKITEEFRKMKKAAKSQNDNKIYKNSKYMKKNFQRLIKILEKQKIFFSSLSDDEKNKKEIEISTLEAENLSNELISEILPNQNGEQLNQKISKKNEKKVKSNHKNKKISKKLNFMIKTERKVNDGDCEFAKIDSAKMCISNLMSRVPPTMCIKPLTMPIRPICPNNMIRRSFFCQSACKQGYYNILGICIQMCPDDFHDFGLFCHRGWFEFKSKALEIPESIPFTSDSVTCPKSHSLKSIGFCFRNCEDLKMKNYFGMCARSGKDLTLDITKTLSTLILSGFKFVAFFFTAGASALAPHILEKAVGLLKTISSKISDYSTNTLDNLNFLEAFRNAIGNKTKEQLSLEISELMTENPLFKKHEQCKEVSKQSCINYVEEMYEKIFELTPNLTNTIEFNKSIDKYKSILTFNTDTPPCEKSLSHHQCVKQYLDYIAGIDPTGIALALSSVVKPFCKFEDESSSQSESSVVPESIWIQIQVHRDSRNVIPDKKCIEYNGFNHSFKISNCDENNGSQLFSFTRNESDGSYIIENKTGRVITSRNPDEKNYNSFISQLNTNDDSQRFYIYKLDSSVKKSSSVEDDNGEDVKTHYIIKPKKVASGLSSSSRCLVYCNISDIIREINCDEDKQKTKFIFHFESKFQTSYVIPSKPTKIQSESNTCFNDVTDDTTGLVLKDNILIDEPSLISCNNEKAVSYQLSQRMNGTFYIQQIFSQRYWKSKEHLIDFATLIPAFPEDGVDDSHASWVVWFKKDEKFVFENNKGYCVTKKKLVPCDSYIKDEDLLFFSETKADFSDYNGKYLIKNYKNPNECVTENKGDQIYFGKCKYTEDQIWTITKWDGPFYVIVNPTSGKSWYRTWSISINLSLSPLHNNIITDLFPQYENPEADQYSYWYIIPGINDTVSFINKANKDCAFYHSGIITDSKLRLTKDCDKKALLILERLN